MASTGRVGAAQEEDSNRGDVAVGFYLINLQRIDDPNQTARIDLVFNRTWKDTALASDEPGIRLFDEDEIWIPEIQIANGGDLRNLLRPIVEVDPDGNAIYRQRLVGDITLPLNFADFPFDRHTIGVQFVGTDVGGEELTITPGFVGRRELFTIPDWDVGPISTRNTQFTVSAEESLPMVEVLFEVKRHSGYYVWKVLIPLMTVVFMSWVVFWIDPRQVAPQVGIAATSILTLIAYRFTLGLQVPRLSYFTRLDIFVIGASLLVFAALVEAIVTINLGGREKLTAAHRVDVFSRVAFPIGFGALLLFSFWG